MKNLISNKASLLDALKIINDISKDTLNILFVYDESNKIIGTVSDGDCRRSIISGKGLDICVSEVMCRKFTYLEHDNYNIESILKIRKLGIACVPELGADGSLYKIRDFSNGKSYIPVDAVIMAGGRGERLRPLTLETPKPLLKVADKPIIDYNIENLMNNGIDYINVTINYLGEQIEEHFKKPIDGTSVKIIRESKFLGTMGAVKYIKEWHNDTVLLMNSDLFTNINLEAFYFDFVKSGADMCVAGVPYRVDIPYGIFSFDDYDNVIGIKEKPSYYYYANAGIYLLKKEIIDFIPEDKMFHATDMIDLLIKKGKKVTKYPIVGYWIDIGKPEDFKKVQEFAMSIK